jgi:hypothetical protein
LGLIVLDGVEEGGIVGGALGGDLARKKVDVAGGGDGEGFGGVLRGEGGVIADDGCAGRESWSCAGREVQSHVSFNFQGGAELDGRDG